MMPDRIYIHRKDNTLEITWSETEEKGCMNTEYICKDALWKWADEYYSKCILNNGRDTGRREVLKSLLHYINRT